MRGIVRIAARAAALACVVATAGCGASGEGFKCGREVSGSSTIRVCDGPGEICVCQTNSCAEPDLDCPAPGFRYLPKPFARSELAGTCVDPRDYDWRVDPAPEPRLCPLTPGDASVLDAVPTDGAPADAAPADGESTDAVAADAMASDT